MLNVLFLVTTPTLFIASHVLLTLESEWFHMEEAQQKVSSAAAESSNSLTTPRKKLKKPAAPAASASAGQDETVKSSLKPKLRIKRNNTGTWIIFLFSVVCDVIVSR